MDRGLLDRLDEGHLDVSGFELQASDGAIGRVVETSMAHERVLIIARIGRWPRRKLVVLPTSIVEAIDPDRRILRLDRTRRQLTRAPRYDPARGLDPSHRAGLAMYFGPAFGASPRTWPSVATPEVDAPKEDRDR